ncbi:DUF6286 domain-containing protein [Lipingzhangella sp. LS1_29]|uniref:DUF6286 domain-containing protein n=1 Tax=Lipingzhangella rawalii TaxID=2055835 RepID=A0ABU2H9I2_9ACTN|nr:DUF6286 domain-containing protein [Lipingzhangella rawalii]MDS1271957.1 DUF6286 domain-containing protein [Lipingzhangella rawalii]
MTTVDHALAPPDPLASQRARRTAVRTFRPRRSWPAFLAGAVLVLVAAVAAAEVISALVGSPLRMLPYQQAASYAEGARWSDPSVRVASAVLAGIGLVLISLAVLPGRSRWLPLRTDDPDLVVGISPAALRRALSSAAEDVDGVRRARVRLGRRSITVRVHTDLGEPGTLPTQVETEVRRRLSELAPLRDLKVRTNVRYAKA